MLTEYEKQLVTENHNLIYSFADKHKLDLEEYYGILALALCKAVKYFDQNKGKISTIAYTCMLNSVRNHIRKKNKKKLALIYLDTDYTNSNNDDESLLSAIANDSLPPDIKAEGKEISQILLSMLTDKEKQIVADRLDGLSEREIGEKMGCTRQNVHAQIKRIRSKWLIFYKSLNTAIC